MFKNHAYQNIENIDNSGPSRPCPQCLKQSLGVYWFFEGKTSKSVPIVSGLLKSIAVDKSYAKISDVNS
jgi:hypothetical protein